MGVSRAPTWGTLTGKPTTVAGLGLSDFNAAAINAQAALTLGQIGSYGSFLRPGTNLTMGSTIAGSSLRKVDSTSTEVSAGMAGTWRFMGHAENNTPAGGLYVRIA